jgi:hypothetical protein
MTLFRFLLAKLIIRTSYLLHNFGCINYTVEPLFIIKLSKFTEFIALPSWK